jgi:hypothetical protein
MWRIFNLTVSVGHNPQINLSDERDALCLSCGEFMGCFFSRTAVRAPSDDAGKHRRDRDGHN